MTAIAHADVAPAPDPWLASREELRQLLVADAMRQLRQHLEDAVSNGPDYVRAYVDATLSPRRMGPHHGDIHPLVAKLIRELVLDCDVTQRRAA